MVPVLRPIFFEGFAGFADVLVAKEGGREGQREGEERREGLEEEREGKEKESELVRLGVLAVEREWECIHGCMHFREQEKEIAYLEVSSAEVLVLMNVQPEIQGILVPFPLKEDLFNNEGRDIRMSSL